MIDGDMVSEVKGTRRGIGYRGIPLNQEYEQKDVFRRTLLDYQVAENRRDDVSVIAFRV